MAVSDRYYNPDLPPEEILIDVDDEIISFILKFKTKEDLLDFNKKTGLNINNKTKHLTYIPKSNRLDGFFE